MCDNYYSSFSQCEWTPIWSTPLWPTNPWLYQVASTESAYGTQRRLHDLEQTQRLDKTYRLKPGKPSIKLELHPEPAAQRSRQPWFGMMSIKCDDVARLMREGFYWDGSNLIQGEGYSQSNIRPPPICLRHSDAAPTGWNPAWKHEQCLILRDLQHEPPLWVAKLSLYGASADILRRVRLESLSTENVARMRARNPSKNRMYGYKAWRKDESYNDVYDDMVMGGWWPWPGKNGPVMPAPVPMSVSPPVEWVSTEKEMSCRQTWVKAFKKITSDVKRKFLEWSRK
ncbi:hypothetical protein SCUP515_09128 [Seiridium cupressi]